MLYLKEVTISGGMWLCLNNTMWSCLKDLHSWRVWKDTDKQKYGTKAAAVLPRSPLTPLISSVLTPSPSLGVPVPQLLCPLQPTASRPLPTQTHKGTSHLCPFASKWDKLCDVRHLQNPIWGPSCPPSSPSLIPLPDSPGITSFITHTHLNRWLTICFQEHPT